MKIIKYLKYALYKLGIWQNTETVSGYKGKKALQKQVYYIVRVQASRIIY